MSKSAALRKDIFCPVVNNTELLMQEKYYLGSKEAVYNLAEVEQESQELL